MDPALPSQDLLHQRDFLRRLARGLLGDDGLAEDVAQEAELRALERGPLPADVRPRADNLRAWLVTVTRRLALNALRARERRAAHERAAARPASVSEHDEALDGLDLQHAVLAAVRALDEPYRTVIWLRYYEERAPGAIAAQLGLPLATVKTRLRRALQTLRAQLDRACPDRTDQGRRAWAVALASFARVPLELSSGSSAALTVGGSLLMKKLAVALALLLIAWLGWRTLGRRPEGVVRSGEASPAADLVAPPHPSQAPAHAIPESARRPALVPAPTPGESPFSAAATLDVLATWERDGSRASGVGLVLWPVEHDLPELHARFAETDAEGRARFEGVAPGRYELSSDRDSTTPVELRAGEEHELALTVPNGLDVLGLVLDGAGQPVAGAEVWLEGQGSGSRAGRIVTRAGIDGTFGLRSLGSQQSLGAFAPGFAPAFLEHLRTKELAGGASEVRVTIVLDREGYELRGRVLDPAGQPVVGARVALGTVGNVVTGRADGREGWRPRARWLTSDADGGFEARWIEVGRPGGLPSALVHVLAPDLAQARTEGAGPGEELLVRLEGGATIEGRVLASAGEPVASALVEVGSAGGIERRSSPFGLPRTHSRVDGSFRLEHVPSGAVELVVSLATDARSGAQETRVLADGAFERWDIILAEARVITGRVVDEQGVGMAGQNVLVSDGRHNSVVESGASGGFVFTPSGGGEEWTLTLVGAGGVLDRREAVRLGAEVVLVARVHRAAVRGGFSDLAGLAPEGEEVVVNLSPDGEHMAFQADLDAQGAFAFENVASGRYRVTIESGGLTLAESAWFEVSPDQVLELAWLESQETGPR